MGHHRGEQALMTGQDRTRSLVANAVAGYTESTVQTGSVIGAASDHIDMLVIV